MEFRHRKRRVAAVASAAAVMLVLAAGGVALAYFTSTGSGAGTMSVGTASTLVIRQTNNVMYDSTVTPLPGSFPSQPFQAQQVSEFGNEISLAHPSQLGSVTVTMESWTCGNWTSGATPCTTTPGTGYTLPITLTLYGAGATGAVGTVIETTTQTFTIPFRPSADPATCNHSTGTTGWLNDAATAAQFHVTADTKCHYGLANNITFDITNHKVLPSKVIYGISFNTQTYGPHPLGHATPATSLNVALNTSAHGPTVGSDVYPGRVDLSSATAGYYCTTAATVGTFSRTGQCWTVNTNHAAPWWVPAVQFTAVFGSSSDLYPGGSARPIDFTVHNPGTSSVRLQSVTISISSITDQHSSTGPACSPSWFAITQPAFSPFTLASHHTATFTNASIRLLNRSVNQDACEGASINLAITAN